MRFAAATAGFLFRLNFHNLFNLYKKIYIQNVENRNWFVKLSGLLRGFI